MKSNLLYAVYAVIFLGVIGFYSCSSNSSSITARDKISTNNSITNDGVSDIPLLLHYLLSPAGVSASNEVREESSKEQISWLIEYNVSGGFAGIRRQLIINSSGHLTANDQKLKRYAEQQISQKQIAEITAILEQLNFSLATKDSSKLFGRCADCFIYTLNLTADNSRKGKVALNDLSLEGSGYAPLIRLLSTILDQSLEGPK